MGPKALQVGNSVLLTLGAVATVAVASRMLRPIEGSAAALVRKEDTFPAYVSYSAKRSSWDRGAPPRYSFGTPSWQTAEAWVYKVKEDGFKRVDYAATPSRRADLRTPRWLMPDGALAPDVDIERRLDGLWLVYHNHRWPVGGLPEDVQRRIHTIMAARVGGREAAIESIRDRLCDRTIGTGERDDLIRELHWVNNASPASLRAR